MSVVGAFNLILDPSRCVNSLTPPPCTFSNIFARRHSTHRGAVLSVTVSLQSRVQAGVFGIVEIFLIEALGQNTASGCSLRFRS
jgi:hypothetical protein